MVNSSLLRSVFKWMGSRKASKRQAEISMDCGLWWQVLGLRKGKGGEVRRSWGSMVKQKTEEPSEGERDVLTLL